MGVKIERSVSVGNILTMLGGVIVAIGIGIGWWTQTQGLAASQKRNKTSIVDNREALRETGDKMRGIERKVDVLEERTKYIQEQQKETNEKLDRLIDMQLRRPR